LQLKKEFEANKQFLFIKLIFVKQEINYNTEDLLKCIFEGIHAKKGKDVLHLDLSKTGNSYFGNFIICHAESNVQVNAIADSVEDTVEMNLNERAWHKEGFENAQWVLLGFDNIVVHIFQKEYRDFYKLEDLWADAEIKVIEDELLIIK
jgi:ribosome-associated protein